VERLTREERKAATREALIRAGCDVVRARGFGVSVEEIANAAGFTKGAVYSNFEGRVELITAIAQRVVLEEADDIDHSAPSLADALEKEARRIAHDVDQQPERFVLTMDMCVAVMRDPALRRALMTREPSARQRSFDWPDHLRPPIDDAWFFLAMNGLAMGLAMQRLTFGADEVPDELFVWAYRQMARDD
jgi:AcrR family transcriptional regulator